MSCNTNRTIQKQSERPLTSLNQKFIIKVKDFMIAKSQAISDTNNNRRKSYKYAVTCDGVGSSKAVTLTGQENLCMENGPGVSSLDHCESNRLPGKHLMSSFFFGVTVVTMIIQGCHVLMSFDWLMT